jgi:hypothetical protein
MFEKGKGKKTNDTQKTGLKKREFERGRESE